MVELTEAREITPYLWGQDLDTGVFSIERRDAQFKILQETQAHVLNLTHWHQFLSALVGAGFRSGEMISSQNALLYAYAFYLIGRLKYKAPEHKLQKANWTMVLFCESNRPLHQLSRNRDGW
jgi:hypothetical protein